MKIFSPSFICWTPGLQEPSLLLPQGTCLLLNKSGVWCSPLKGLLCYSNSFLKHFPLVSKIFPQLLQNWHFGFWFSFLRLKYRQHFPGSLPFLYHSFHPVNITFILKPLLLILDFSLNVSRTQFHRSNSWTKILSPGWTSQIPGT